MSEPSALIASPTAAMSNWQTIQHFPSTQKENSKKRDVPGAFVLLPFLIEPTSMFCNSHLVFLSFLLFSLFKSNFCLLSCFTNLSLLCLFFSFLIILLLSPVYAPQTIKTAGKVHYLRQWGSDIHFMQTSTNFETFCPLKNINFEKIVFVLFK